MLITAEKNVHGRQRSYEIYTSLQDEKSRTASIDPWLVSSLFQFDKTGQMLKEAFEHAHDLSVMTCVGTETPLAKPPVNESIMPLYLYFSEERQDHFLTTTSVRKANC